MRIEDIEKKDEALAFMGVPHWNSREGDWFVLLWRGSVASGRLTFIIRHPQGPDAYWEWKNKGKRSGDVPAPKEWKKRIEKAAEELEAGKSRVAVIEWAPEIAAWIVEYRSEDPFFHRLAPDHFFRSLNGGEKEKNSRARKRRS